MEHLYRKLKEYANTGYYPFHMPGHKRNTALIGSELPYELDITEIDGFDDLHHSEGILKEKLFPGRAGTPSENDFIISFDVTFQAGMGQERHAVTEAHKMCDRFLQEFREQLKKFRGESCTERHEYHDIARPGKKRVLIVKQVAGQGAMYDMHLFGKEPSGMEGGKSIIDMGNMPILVTPNEYRDGILRSMQ